MAITIFVNIKIIIQYFPINRGLHRFGVLLIEIAIVLSSLKV